MSAELQGIPCLTVHPEPRGWFCNVVGENWEYNLYSNLDGTLYCMYIPTANLLENNR